MHENYAMKIIGHCACLRENGDLSLSRVKPCTKSCHFGYVRGLITHALITRKILGWVVRKRINTNPGLKVDRQFNFSCLIAYLLLMLD